MGDSQMRSQVLGLDHRLIPNNENEIPHKNYLQLHMKYYDVSENPASNRLIISLDSNKLMNSENAYVGRNHTEITFTFMRFMDNFINTDSYTGFDDAKQAAATEEMLLNYDKLIINHGHWAMHSYQIGGHYSVERYVDSIEYGADLIDLINRRRHIHHKEPLDVVWNGMQSAFFLMACSTKPMPTNRNQCFPTIIARNAGACKSHMNGEPIIV
ncbi:hypothetical protein BDR26DRAFT_890105 [Obelidium mucronatum]|nr:hypothetical protein BDR26DRAFT_890105 [Obelidium mucronatum]